MKVKIENVLQTSLKLKDVITHTALDKNFNFSENYKSNIYFKREDLQIVRSYKLRGAYNLISSLPKAVLDKGVVCASAGNHAQGFAYSCLKLNTFGVIYMPGTTPRQKISQVKMFGKDNIEIRLVGDTFDEAYAAAMEEVAKTGKEFIHPFNDLRIIEGQATVGVEIFQDLNETIDYVFLPIGGGGLVSGVGSYLKAVSPNTKIIGVEPAGAPSMKASLAKGEVVTLNAIDSFVDGAAVKTVGDINFEITKDIIDDIITIPEGKVCSTIIKLYNEEAIVAEPAGALSVAALDEYKEEIVGKNVVVIISGGNNDLNRMQEIRERSLLYEGLKHYFLIKFPQRAGALREYLDSVLGPTDDITQFEYAKKNSRDSGPALIAVELKYKEDYASLIERMKENGIVYTYLNNDPILFEYFV